MEIRQQINMRIDYEDWGYMAVYNFFLRDLDEGRDFIDDESYEITDKATTLIYEYKE